MAQQINLCTAVSAPPRQRFPASTLFSFLAASLVLLAAFGTFWLWSLGQSAKTYRLTLETQGSEIQNLQAAIQRSRVAAGPTDPDLLREVQNQRLTLAQREKVLQQLRQGLFAPGSGHSDRLLLLARSIPADTWLTEVRADSAAFEVSGFTLEPASLNDWVTHLGQTALMKGLKLDTVTVSYVGDGAATPAKPASAPVTRTVPTWSFHLISVAPVAPSVATAATPQASVPGGKP